MTRNSPARALAAVVCARAINSTCPGVFGEFLYGFTTEDLYVVFPRRIKQGKMSLGSVPHSRVELLKLNGEDRIRAATDRMER